MRLMPCSTAARIVAMDSASSVPPHIQPPMAQVPRATRDTSSDVPTMAARSISISPDHYGLLRPCALRRYSRPRGWRRLWLLPSRHRHDRAQVLTFRTKAWSSFAPPICRMPLGQSQDILQADPGGRVTPRFWHRLNRFRHFNSGSLALASLNHACWDHVPTFPQRSPPSLLTTAACGSLRSAPDCRTRRALLHLPYSCALPCGRAMLVTQDPNRT